MQLTASVVLSMPDKQLVFGLLHDTARPRLTLRLVYQCSSVQEKLSYDFAPGNIRRDLTRVHRRGVGEADRPPELRRR